MSLLFLSDKDFVKAGTVVRNPIRGYSLVFFYAPSCPHSKRRVPLFRELPRRIGGCSFAMVDITRNMGIVNKSKNSTLEIEYVPLIVLYVDGVPNMVYTGPPTIDDIIKFIVDVVHVLSEAKKKKQAVPQFSRETETRIHQNVSKKSRIPMYSIGIPKISDVTYLEVDCTADTFIR